MSGGNGSERILSAAPDGAQHVAGVTQSAVECPRSPVALCRVDSDDIDDQAYMLGGWRQNYLQCERGFFKSVVHKLTLPGATVFSKSTNRKLIKRFAPPSNEMALALLLPGSDPATFLGRPVVAGDVLTLVGGQEYELICHGQFNVAVASVDLNTAAPAYDQDKPASSSCGLRNDLDSFRRALSRVASAATAYTKHDVLEVLSVAHRLCLDRRQPANGGGAHTAGLDRNRAIALFEEFRQFTLDRIATYGEVPTLDAVVRALGVSLRTLEINCKAVINAPPKRYLTYMKLHCARRELRTRPGSTSVTDVALKWGFSHLGRFSSEYRSVFGEMPSETRIAEPVRARSRDRRSMYRG